MTVASLNNVSTQDSYTDALTVVFPRPRAGFTLHVSNAAIFYTVAILGADNRDASFAPDEHMLLPSLSTFDNPATEGFPATAQWAGVKVRSAVAGIPAQVTVA